MGDDRAEDQPAACRSPHGADADRSALKNDVAKQIEQYLGSASAGGPTNADESDAEDERGGAHVAQAFHVFVPWAHDGGFGERLAGVGFGCRRRALRWPCVESAGDAKLPDAGGGKQERERIEA